MSVAFTKELDTAAIEAVMPDRPISPHPNFVTQDGLTALDASLDLARDAYVSAFANGNEQIDQIVLGRAVRDLRYYASRRANAQLITYDDASKYVRFGSRVTIERQDGRRQTFRIVGEDEADPALGSISYVSPVARALTGKTIGDLATSPGGEVEIIDVE